MVPLYYDLRSLWARRLSTVVTVTGLGLVVFVFASVLMLAKGIEAALRAGGSSDNAVLLRSGAETEISSLVDRDGARVVSSFPEIAASLTGAQLVAPELVVLVALPTEGGATANVTARGVQPESFTIRRDVRVVSGRAPRAGTSEVALGKSLVGRSTGASVGGEIRFAQSSWTVVGVLDAHGGAFESEIWVDERKLAAAYDRSDYSSIVARLEQADLLDAFRRRVEADGRLTLKVEREDLYWEGAASGTASFIRVLGLFVAVVFSGGAVVGAMITMAAQVAARTRELAMMRALGFRRRSVLAAVVVESALIGGAGGVLGVLGALAMQLVEIRTLNFQTFAEVRFGFHATPGIISSALAFGLAMGVIGGLLPAVRASRLPILEATRA